MCRVGLFPVSLDHLRKFSYEKDIITTEGYNIAHHDGDRKEAGKDFLNKELKFKVDEINIVATKLAPKPESQILWIETSEANVKKIYSRAAALKNKNIRLITYFPAELWERKVALDKHLKLERVNEPNLRTQVRLGTEDLELNTKHVGEPLWQVTPVTAYGELPPVGARSPRPSQPFSPPRERGVTYIGSDHLPKRKATSPVADPAVVKKGGPRHLRHKKHLRHLLLAFGSCFI